MNLEEMVKVAKEEMERANEENDGLLIVEIADICIGKLWAEAACLQAEVERLWELVDFVIEEKDKLTVACSRQRIRAETAEAKIEHILATIEQEVKN